MAEPCAKPVKIEIELITFGPKVAGCGGAFDGVIGQIIELRDQDRVVLLLDLLKQKTKLHIDAKSLRTL
jgi:hypothetical protein